MPENKADKPQGLGRAAAIRKKTELEIEFSEWLEEKAGISQKLLDSLESDDDWTFVIKIHGILEVGLNHLILSRLNNPKTDKIVSHLETNNDRRGKIAFLKAYDLLPPNAISFVRLLSDLRNAAVHDIKTFDLSLETYFLNLNKSEQNNWIDAFSWWVNPPLKNDIKRAGSLIIPREWIRTASITILSKSFEESTFLTRALRAYRKRLTQPPKQS